ncbi:hypothetical protein Acr_14g0009070 [Actinidia rufa]|uniref:DUF7356 domain-containing protein n=1 Tax=Actinidia rufa TaxID=165716 RepID=A0A7J0FRC7_9ERIC|nr:hypothetical protein Acr_14g0009070 [Actinidia rufa]
MMVKYMFLLILCCAAPIAVGRVSTELEGNEISKPGLDKKSHSPLNNNSNLNEKTGGLKSVVDSNKVDQVKEEKDQVGGSKEGVENNKANEKSSSEQKQVGSKEDQVGKKDKDDSVGKGEKKEKVSEGSDSKGGTKEKPTLKKEGSHGEECDASNSCKDEKNDLVACLRVPGNESPDLSLLIQNKGNGPLSVTISAPDFVQLEKTKVQLQEKEDSKIKVSIKKEGTGSLITLTAGDGHCSIDFRDLISPNLRKETDHSANSRHIIAIPLMVLGLLVVAASAWLCVRFVRMYGPTYQKLAMELPVMGGSKEESEFNDGWNNNWDDNWDDEEAPKTPSMPVTPSLSSKGLASRRFNKEGWKD